MRKLATFLDEAEREKGGGKKKKGAILLCLRVRNQQTTTDNALHIVPRRLYKATRRVH